ncbi:DUF1223 domain-containing protein [Marinobacter sp. JSM 1782161]|uniref:DUF1223 domain-containing protein n=1 Tax=Marinobacter sp. JSM 1782161 TaxID=2685906 RepID=UPI00140407DD|nr:DUF1223 domain-containing protein [Marinobacter sp. JSM 1782161]
MFRQSLYGLLLVAMAGDAFAEATRSWQSRATATDTVELFTSEGCSSCPPADLWLQSLAERPGLFSDFIPLAFHVDYWDQLGWKDRLADAAFSERQRTYVRSGAVSQVYTPGIVINSREWRAWFRGAENWSSEPGRVGILQASLDADRRLTASFDGSGKALTLHAAYLGMGIETPVKAGENEGRTLTHDFVVLDLLTADGMAPWTLRLPEVPDAGQTRTALAVWVSEAGSPAIIQSVGGFLD